ncbi:alanine racemase [Winogradskyella wichelsiae]|uniref:alanine racemase n=1 Tax=Winogradskyella wichelsiae TaxID=2697007 RepID=UPI0015CA88F1|nr:alanine racemase [Winogradskyella wichelsiae]
MAELIIHSEKIKENLKYLSYYFETHNIAWSLITKLFSGDKIFIKTILTEDIIEKIPSVGDSRLMSLRNIRAVYPDVKTIYINPSIAEHADDVVTYADISLNTSITTIEALNEAARKKNVIHKIIIMVELGDLREGINNEDILAFYKSVFNLSHIEVLGIGSNLGCLFGVAPTPENLMQLSLSKTLISEKFNTDLKFLSGGTSITLPLIENNLIPKEINHFRVGEAAFLGICPLDGKQFKELNTDTFELHANIIELQVKNVVPGGIINAAHSSETIHNNEKNNNVRSYKAILDFGLLDVSKSDIEAENSFLYVGATSDMFVIDLGENKEQYKLGDKIKFKLNYMAVVRLLNSKFIDKVYV